ncbi:hypothetical protein BM525_21575 (plasmid) [Alteromonas mediterranea]|uniref:Uncharacterized protein n=1 Tax=Alteromonas mediterranea TaxID=314275 RepID=A0AAC9JHV4_9ALTE|nr:hypothetical protein [Alteromonas mediterranea]APD92452.1 hypothetical protein BM524_21355 [Alteromonas mediterranea]APE00313.1 hypothetical protein BM525_21575 [Alteromonas mediterranea]
MNRDLAKLNQKNILNTIKAKQVAYFLNMSGKSKEETSSSLRNLVDLCEAISKVLIKDRLELNIDETRVYLRSPELPDTEYYAFTSQVLGGYSPFVIFNEYDDKGKKVRPRGVLINLNCHNFVYCTKAIDKLSREMLSESIRDGVPASLKEIKKSIKSEIKAGNRYNIPIVEKISTYSFYINAEDSLALCKSSKSDSHAVRAFFSLLKKLSNYLFAQDDSSTQLLKLAESALQEPYFPEPFCTYAINEGLACNSYNINNMVEYYAENQTEGADACAVLPTHSAKAHSNDDSTQRVTFKNSIGIFSGNVVEETASFDELSHFCQSMNMKYSALTVIGEIPVSKQMQEYFKERPEAQEEWGARGFIPITFETTSKDGNICFQIKEGMNPIALSCRGLLDDYTKDNAVSPENAESVMLNHFSGMLSLFHDCSELFIKLYIDCSQPPETFGDSEAA